MQPQSQPQPQPLIRTLVFKTCNWLVIVLWGSHESPWRSPMACFLEREVCRKLHVFCVFLRENYLFNCTCPKCESQSGDPDVTSSEDDDDSMEEDSWHRPWLFLFIMGNREFVKDTANVVFHLEMPYLEYYSLGLYAESGATLLVGIWWWENKNK